MEENKPEENKLEKKDWLFGCGGCLGIIFILGLVLFLFMGCMADMTEEQKKDDNKQLSEQEKIEETNKRLEEKSKETEKSQEKEETKKKEKKKEKDSEKIKHNKQDGFDVYERDGGMAFSENSSIKHFSMEMSNRLKKDHKKIDNGAIFKDVMEFEDKKGNKEKIVAIVTYISKETIDEINFDNWPNNPESLYDVSDGVVFHYYINDNKIAKTRNQDEIPQQFYDMLGEEK